MGTEPIILLLNIFSRAETLLEHNGKFQDQVNVVQNKRFIWCLPLIICVLFICIFIMSSDTKDRTTFKRHFGFIPTSVQNIKTEGTASLAGANEIICFEISSADLRELLEKNDFESSSGELLNNGENIINGKDGQEKDLNDLEFAKFQAQKMGVIPSEIYLTKKSSFSNYKILIVGKTRQKTRQRVFFKYVK